MSVDITRLTAHLSPEQQDEVKRAYRRRHENSTAAFLWCFFFGTLGAHRFYLKQWGAGLLRLLVPLIAAAVVVAGIALKLQPAIIVAVVIVLLLIALLWEIIDLFRIDHEVYTRNLKLAEELTASALLSDHSLEQQTTGRMEGLMLQARDEAASAARAERREVAADAAVAVPAVEAAVAQPASLAAAGDTTEVAEAAEARSSDAAAVASDTYVARSVTAISDDPNVTQHAARAPLGPQNDWSATESVHIEDEQARTAEDDGAESVRDLGALGAAGVALGGAAVAGYALDEAITRTHSETDHSTTDSLETHATLSAAEAEQEDVAVAAEADDVPAPVSVPTLSEAEAPTWPDHPLVMFEEPQQFEPDAAGDLVPTESSFDVTDTTGVMGAVKPVADIEPEAVPLIIALPALAGAASALDPTTNPGDADETLVEPVGSDSDLMDVTDLYVAPAVPASETGDEVPLLLVPVAELDEPRFGAAADASAAWPAEVDAVPAEAYIPPTVPVVTAEPTAEELAAKEPVPVTAEEPAASNGETLAELAAFAGAAGVGVASVDALAHHDAPSAEDAPQPAQVPAFSAFAAEPADAASSPEAEIAPGLEPEPAPVAAAAAPLAAEAATAAAGASAVAAEQPRRRLRRIREYLQVKRDGQVVEELVAEELVEVDEDPEPVRVRLREQLHREAVERGLE